MNAVSWIFPKCIGCYGWWYDCIHSGHSSLIKYQHLLTRRSLFCRHMRIQQKAKLYVAKVTVRSLSEGSWGSQEVFLCLLSCLQISLGIRELPLLIHCWYCSLLNVELELLIWSLLWAPVLGNLRETFGWNVGHVFSGINYGLQFFVFVLRSSWICSSTEVSLRRISFQYGMEGSQFIWKDVSNLNLRYFFSDVHSETHRFSWPLAVHGSYFCSSLSLLPVSVINFQWS